MPVTDAMGSSLRRNGVVVNGVKSIGTVGPGRALRDVTTLADTVHKHKKNIPDLPEIEVELFYDPDDTMHQRIWRDDADAVTVPWQIFIEQGNSPLENWEFPSCYVINATIGPMEIDGDITMTFSLKPQAMPVGVGDV